MTAEEKIKKYILEANYYINFKKDLEKNKRYFIDTNSKEFWQREKKRYLQVRRERKYLFNEQAKKEFLNKNNLPLNTIIFGLYFPVYYFNNNMDLYCDRLKYLLDKVDKCIVLFFTDLKNFKCRKIHEKIKFIDLSNEKPRKAIDFVLSISSHYQLKFFGLKPVWYFLIHIQNEDKYSIENITNFMNNNWDSIKLQEQICFDKIENYKIINNRSYNIFKMGIYSFKNFGISESVIKQIYELKDYSRIQFLVEFTRYMIKYNNLLVAQKAKSYMLNYLILLKRKIKNKKYINCKDFNKMLEELR